MKPRKSTAILISVWIATLVIYVFVKPPTGDHSGLPHMPGALSGTPVVTAHPQ
ncbi:MAG: hypothetical protein J2P18_00390 [Nocardia sp.]|nr:hypothetical protein [Nocardia sp.]